MRVSVIIPTCNRERELLLCLKALEKQTLKPQEVIVVSDGEANLGNLSQEYHFKLVKTRGYAGQSVAKNLGAKIAREEILAFLDDDSIPHQKWLAELSWPLKNKGIAAVSGRILEKGGKNRRDSFADIILNLPFYPLYLLLRKKQGGTIYPNGRVDADLESAGEGFCHWGGAGNLAIKKSYLEKAGGFDESLFLGSALEEPDLCSRIQILGGRIFYNGKAIVTHYHSAQRILNRKEAVYNLRANEVYFGLKNITFQNPFNFFSFWGYQAWQILIYFLLGLGQKRYWSRIGGKWAGFKHWQNLKSRNLL